MSVLLSTVKRYIIIRIFVRIRTVYCSLSFFVNYLCTNTCEHPLLAASRRYNQFIVMRYARSVASTRGDSPRLILLFLSQEFVNSCKYRFDFESLISSTNTRNSATMTDQRGAQELSQLQGGGGQLGNGKTFLPENMSETGAQGRGRQGKFPRKFPC